MTDLKRTTDRLGANTSVLDNDRGAAERAKRTSSPPSWRWVHPDERSTREPRTMLPWRWLHPNEAESSASGGFGSIEEVHKAAAHFRAGTSVLDGDQVAVERGMPSWHWANTHEPPIEELHEAVLDLFREVTDGRALDADEIDVDELVALTKIGLEVGNRHQAQSYLSKALQVIPNNGELLQQLERQSYATLSAWPLVVAIVLVDSPGSRGAGLVEMARARQIGAQQVQGLPPAQEQRIGAPQAQAQQPGEQPQAQQPGEQAPGQQPGGQPQAQQPGEQPQVQQPGEQAPGQQPGEQAPGQQPGEQPQAQQPGEQPQAQQPGEQAQGQQPVIQVQVQAILQPQEQQAEEEIDLQELADVQDLLTSVFDVEDSVDLHIQALSRDLEDIDILDLCEKSVEISRQLKDLSKFRRMRHDA